MAVLNPEQQEEVNQRITNGKPVQVRILLRYVAGATLLPEKAFHHIIFIIIHSKYFPVSDWLKPHA